MGEAGREITLVIGMHRSGTSVAARLVNLLGLEVCRSDDLVRGHARYGRRDGENR